MISQTSRSAGIDTGSRPPSAIERLVRRALRGRLARLRHGRIVVKEERGRAAYGQPTEICPLSATVTVHDPAFYTELALGGSIGAAEAYMDGLWSTDDLTAV